MQARSKYLQKIFAVIPSYETILAAVLEKQPNNTQIDEQEFLVELQKEAEQQKELIQNPNVPKLKPIGYLLTILSSFATKPFICEIGPLIEKYAVAVTWDVKMKEYVGKRDSWESGALDTVGEINAEERLQQLKSEGIFSDSSTLTLFLLKQRYQEFLASQSEHYLEVEMQIAALEDYIQ